MSAKAAAKPKTLNAETSVRVGTALTLVIHCEGRERWV